MGARLEARGGDGGRTGGQPKRDGREFQRSYGGSQTGTDGGGAAFAARHFDGSDGANDGVTPVKLANKL